MAERPPTAGTGVPTRYANSGGRPVARDTGDVLRDLTNDLDRLRQDVARDFELFAERFKRDHDNLADRLDVRLNQGAEKFTRMDEKLVHAIAVADAAKKATDAKPLPWLRVIPIVLSILTLAGTIVVTMDRKVGGEAFSRYTEASAARERELELKILELQKDLAVSRTSSETLKAVLDAVTNKATIATPRRPR